MIRGTDAGSWTVAALGLLLPMVGCETPRPGGSPPATAGDSAGIRVVEYSSIPADLPSWSVSPAPVLTIGSADGSDPDVFGRIESIAVVSDGAIVVADGLSGELRAFDRAGQHLWTAGRIGGGPGEFSSLEGVHAFAGDSIIAVGGGRVVSIFDSQGRYARQVRLEPPPGEYPAGPVVNGATFGGTLVGSALQIPTFEPGYYRTSLTLIFYDSSGRSTAQFGPLLHGEGALTILDGGAYTSSLVPMGRGAQVAIGREHVAVTTQERFEIIELDEQGSVTSITRAASEPVPVDAEVRRRYLELVLADEDEDAARKARQETVFAEALPAIGRILYDSDGHLWVEQYTPPYENRAHVWSVFDRTRTFIARVTVPADLTPQHVYNDLLIGTALNALNIPMIRVHRLSRTPLAAHNEALHLTARFAGRR